ncbi:2-amino-4-hydroxy-6-hydroxymethyldihydropteridine pyrophosphokinase [Bacteroidia bacterium]|nr:2-amino-4-hydroxy-6-hydroxymethyldihydropteridine pyrophosphokinase [Bacteroidia bacterium]
MSHTVYLALGTNLGDKQNNLLRAIFEIATQIGTVSAVSSVYESEPWGYVSENTFLNMAVRVETDLSPLDLLHGLQNIEKQMGRTQKSQSQIYQDRLIDIDIILYDDLEYNSEELTIPHPFYQERDFVMQPLNEIRCHCGLDLQSHDFF